MAMKKGAPFLGSKIHRKLTDSFREAPCARTGDEVGGPFSREMRCKRRICWGMIAEYMWIYIVILKFCITYLYVYIDFAGSSLQMHSLSFAIFSSFILRTWLNRHTLCGIAKVDIPESQLRQQIKFGKPMYLYDPWSQRTSSWCCYLAPRLSAHRMSKGRSCVPSRGRNASSERCSAKGNSSCVKIFRAGETSMAA